MVGNWEHASAATIAYQASWLANNKFTQFIQMTFVPLTHDSNTRSILYSGGEGLYDSFFCSEQRSLIGTHFYWSMAQIEMLNNLQTY